MVSESFPFCGCIFLRQNCPFAQKFPVDYVLYPCVGYDFSTSCLYLSHFCGPDLVIRAVCLGIFLTNSCGVSFEHQAFWYLGRERGENAKRKEIRGACAPSLGLHSY